MKENPTVKHEHECLISPGGAKKQHRTFEEVFIEAVDEGLSCLGESGKQAVYFHLEKRFGIKKCEIAFRVEDFADAL